MARKRVPIRKSDLELAEEEGRRKMKEVEDMLSSDSFRKALKEVEQNPKIMSEIKADPKGFLERKGIVIPEGAEVSFSEKDKPDERKPWKTKSNKKEKELDDIMDSDVIQEIVHEVSRNASVEAELKANPKGVLIKKGIRIPEGVEIEIREGSFCYYVKWLDWVCRWEPIRVLGRTVGWYWFCFLVWICKLYCMAYDPDELS